MSDQNWIVELDQLDYQGFFETDAEGNPKKIVGRNHLLLIANGYVGVRGCLGEMFDDNIDSSIHAIGLYDQLGYDDPSRDIWKEIINNPDFMTAYMTFEGERVFINRAGDNVEDFRIWLDMKTAILHLQYTWRSSRGHRLQVDLERFCAHHEKNLVYNVVNVTSLDVDGRLDYRTGITGDVRDAHGKHLEDFFVDACEGGYLLVCRTQQHKYRIAVSSKHHLTADAPSEITREAEAVWQTFHLDLKKNAEVTVTSQHAFYTSRDALDPVADALRADWVFTEERAKHVQALQTHWDLANVDIEVDEAYIDRYLTRDLSETVVDRVGREVKYGLVPETEREARIQEELDKEVLRVKRSDWFMKYNLYLLMVSVMKDYDYGSIPSRSLSYSTYKGSIFWEVDTYAFPFFAAVYPEYARNHLAYRYKCLEYAVNKAADGGHEGAFFAWESLDTGEEATKKFVWQDIHSGRMMRNYFGDRQWHIAGDVIYATWQYYDLTGDWPFIEEYGALMTLLTARFVGSLVYLKVPRDRYEILHTCCPDEYHEEVGNNAFTNRILRFVLEKAVALVGLMEERCPGKLAALRTRLHLDDDEIEYWRDIIEKMYVIGPNEHKVIEQHDGYFALEDISIEEFKSRIVRDEYLGHPIGPAAHTQIIKQADTVQLLVMFKNEYHPIVRKATFDYYDLRTEHGSGDSPNAYGIVAAQVGRIDRALWYFLRSARIDLESANPATKANFQLGGVHIAPPGGTWQVVHYGFAGFELHDDVLCFNPILPKGWNRVTYRFQVRGNLLTVAIDRDTVTLSSRPGNAPLRVRINDREVSVLGGGDELTAAYRKMGNHYYTYNDLGVRIAKEPDQRIG